VPAGAIVSQPSLAESSGRRPRGDRIVRSLPAPAGILKSGRHRRFGLLQDRENIRGREGADTPGIRTMLVEDRHGFFRGQPAIAFRWIDLARGYATGTEMHRGRAALPRSDTSRSGACATASRGARPTPCGA